MPYVQRVCNAVLPGAAAFFANDDSNRPSFAHPSTIEEGEDRVECAWPSDGSNSNIDVGVYQREQRRNGHQTSPCVG